MQAQDAPAATPQTPTYKITVVDDTSTAKRSKKNRMNAQAVIKVLDENGLPVAGIPVTFTIPQFAGGAEFASGGPTSVTTTNVVGTAYSGTFSAPGGASSFNMSVGAAVPGGTITAAVPVGGSTALAGAGAAGAGAPAVGGANSAAGGGMSKGLLIGIIGGVGAAVAAGVMVGLKGSAAPAGPAPTGTIGAAGTPTFGHP